MQKYKKVIQKQKKLRCQLQDGIINLNYLADHILYQIFKIILSILSKTWRKDS